MQLQDIVGIEIEIETMASEEVVDLLGEKFKVKDYSTTNALDGYTALVIISMSVTSVAGVLSIFDFARKNLSNDRNTVTKFTMKRTLTSVEIDFEGTDPEVLTKLIDDK